MTDLEQANRQKVKDAIKVIKELRAEIKDLKGSKVTYSVEYIKHHETFFTTIECNSNITIEELQELQIEDVSIMSIKDINEY